MEALEITFDACISLALPIAPLITHGAWHVNGPDSSRGWCAQELEVSEFVLSNELVSMALAMVAENPEVNDILSELFTPDGNELYVHPASRYLRCLLTACRASLQQPFNYIQTAPSLPLP